MKDIQQFITEKILINKNTSIGFDPDDLPCDKFYEKCVLYDDKTAGDENDLDTIWSDFEYMINEIDNLNNGFLVCRWKPLSKITNEDDINDYSDSFDEIVKRIITGKDLGYKVSTINGHIEIDCYNSGSKATYYIYALSNKGYDVVESWFDGDEGVQPKDFINQECIIPIKMSK